ncbi:hypothetical protein [Pseudoalteromonas denitrificans]|uniref:Uncharacterized protein n=1 Tax=Pseudoalteromonas denitrificans DSM 6059 TaxID=1123010 RepID=A0A1I1IUN6_9GAMM|nr:hypothetical protein [Pseudoalteromonas denitrificans]SFC38018.1 hypothetical protein SAMN02745724_01556 [Pseudoalteromonas denitrificans DSM 6059]
MKICTKNHHHWSLLDSLPLDKNGFGRYKCAGCAYEKGYQAGENREETFNIDLDSLHETQSGSAQYKSPHAAFAQGYYDGISNTYSNECS